MLLAGRRWNCRNILYLAMKNFVSSFLKGVCVLCGSFELLFRSDLNYSLWFSFFLVVGWCFQAFFQHSCLEKSSSRKVLHFRRGASEGKLIGSIWRESNRAFKWSEVVNDLNETCKSLKKIMQLSSQNKFLGCHILSHNKIISLMW